MSAVPGKANGASAGPGVSRASDPSDPSGASGAKSSGSLRNILILQLARLGDLVQTVPLLRRMRREHSEARIVLVALEGPSGILSDCGYFDRLVTLPLKDLEGLSDPGNQDRFPDLVPFSVHPEFRQSWDLIVNLTNDLGSAVLCEKIPATEKLGRINTYAGELRLLGPWAKYLFSMVSHRRDNLFNLVDIQMGMAGLKPEPEEACLQVPEAREREAHSLLASLGRRPGRKLVALQTGASELHRAWSLENFAAVAQDLSANGFADIVLMGDAGERARTEQLAEMIGMPVLNLAGRTPLPLLPAVLQACDLLISNDTGTIHVAAATGTPTLGLYFSTAYFSETAPYGGNHAVLQVEIPCAPCYASARCPVQLCRDYLAPEAVVEASRWLLDTAGRAPGEALAEPPRAHPNLSLYRSRFLANGSLIYLPARSEHPSPHYLTGLIGRLLWEEVLGLSRDPILEELWRNARGTKAWERKLSELEAALAALAIPFHSGLQLAADLHREFDAEVPSRERIHALHGDLARLGAPLAGSAKEAGLVGSFLQYEIMDMDYAHYPALAGLLRDKYGKLAEWIARIEATLRRLAR
ncbi:MAG: glycosyltransferase family 9 protein [Fibrobacteria bacterium]